MEERVINNIIRYNLIRKKENIIVGVSGGADSMAMLYALIKAREQIDFNIIVAHVNHGVRGHEALEDELFVEKKARELGLAHYSTTVDMVGYGRKRGISPEEAGRELRYGFFREIASEVGGGKIAVAHNMNDQAETLLMRIMRGTGVDGLKGMDFIVEDIIRPILNINREDIEKYIRVNKIDTILDKTNLMPIYTRNQIRLELIPYIEENFNPNLINTLWRLSQTASLDGNFLQEYTSKVYNLTLKSEKKDFIVLDAHRFNMENVAIRQRIIRKSLENLIGNLQGFGEQHIVSMVELFESMETGKEIHLPYDIIGVVDYGDLKIYKKDPKVGEDFIYQLNLDHNELSRIGYRIEIKILPRESIDLKNRKTNIRYFDYDKVEGKLYIRNRRNGDRFVPFGMKGRKKIKDYFIDEKISRELRDNIPLIVDEENILWVIGYRTSDLYRISKDTKNVLAVEYHYSN